MSERSSLTSQLQQAWLQTQMAKPSKNLPASSAAPPATAARSVPQTRRSSSFPGGKESEGKASSGICSGEVSDSSSNVELSGGAPSPASVLWTSSAASYDGSGSMRLSEAVSSPFSRTESTLNLEGDAWELLSPPTQEQGALSLPLEQQQGEDPTVAYFTELLSDKDMGKQTCMMLDCMAYQAMHNELADLIGDVGSRLDFSDARGKCPNAAVESWMSSVLSASPPKEDEFLFSDFPPDSMLEDHSEFQKMWANHNQGNGAVTGGDVDGHASGGQGNSVSPHLPCFDGATVPSSPEAVASDASETLENVTNMLLECAQAVVADDVNNANMLVSNIREFATPYGSHLQRLAHYFVEGLVAKLSGTGAELYTALNRSSPCTFDMLKAFQLYVEKVPLVRMAHYYANSIILDAVEGADRVHIIEYGILYGHQFPSLMQALASRPGGPPQLLRITGIEFPQSGVDPDGRVKETGRKLADFASGLGIPFEYKAIADKWENVQLSTVSLRQEEVLVVSCMFRLRHLLDESVQPFSPRRKVLERISSMKPNVFVTGVVSNGSNAPFYMTRLRQAIAHYHAFFEAMDATIPRESPERHCHEKAVLGREILNTVACEGVERLERPELYTQWQRRLLNAGFRQLPMKDVLFNATREMLRGHHESFGIGQDGQWLLLGWKDTVLNAITAWQPADQTAPS